ncbi:Golgi SNAP receptor complex member 1 [Condylostylus longicornis]|uniref:Golgi SNAP receptor complex member 1 n=1 Tax=Condylostylus longicornis TaxID=2530218 RepID=UPI00244E549A|nr:Golgi SNAP receptor complex member 1 [Condylostylus longicornis]
MTTSNYDGLRKQARQLENEIDMKLVAFSKVGAGSVNASDQTSPLLGEHVFDSLSAEITEMLDRLSSVNEMLAELPSTGTASMHTLQRHREILQGYRQEFNKICANHTTRMEREELLRGSGLSNTGTLSNPTTSGLSRRDMYLKESGHIMNSHNMINDQISIALETKDHLLSQRHSFKRFQTRLNDISNRFPLISSLLQRINIKKRRDSLILGAIIGVCTVLLLLYVFS